MSKSSKGPKLRYDDHYARIYDDVTGMLLADLYRLGRHKSREAATQELHVLGRKMAASPELVDLVRDAFATDAELEAKFRAETGQAPPDEAPEEEQSERRAHFSVWLTRFQLELTRRAKAALEKAGVKP